MYEIRRETVDATRRLKHPLTTKIPTYIREYNLEVNKMKWRGKETDQKEGIPLKCDRTARQTTLTHLSILVDVVELASHLGQLDLHLFLVH